jgi:phytoene dehydrogenase-like protein
VAEARYDAVVVGAGPNGLAAAIELARAGRSVCVVERATDVGGGTRTAALTLPGYLHDVCSAIHPLGLGSPFLAGLPLADHGLEYLQPEIHAAHPLDDGSAVVLRRSVAETAAGLGTDAGSYASLMGPLVRDWDEIAELVLGPLRPPRHPLSAARFGLHGLVSASFLARRFKGERARALFGGMAAHSMLPLNQPPTAAFALVLLALGHTVGWPVARGGSQSITEAMAAYLRSLGGVIELGHEVRSMADIPPADRVLFDVTPRQLLAIAGGELPSRYRAELGRYRYGPGVFKLDYALSAPVPWIAPECRRATTVHLGGSFEQIAAAERIASSGGHSPRPFVLVAQQSLIDPTRAPQGNHTLWAYCHVPNGSALDMTEPIEAQIERFAPGFGELVLARAARGTAEIEAENPNYIGGDINGGLIFLCSSSTPPGGGVHGMCGHHAARRVLRSWGAAR